MIRESVQPRLQGMAWRRLRRMDPPTAPKPATIIAHIAGPGTAPEDEDPAGIVPVGLVVMGSYLALNVQSTMSCALQSAPVLAVKPT